LNTFSGGGTGTPLKIINSSTGGGILLTNDTGARGIGPAIRGYYTTSNGAGLEISGNDTGTTGAWVSFGGSVRGDAYNSSTVFTNAGAERMRISGTTSGGQTIGYVGIGTAVPSTALHVVGNITVTTPATGGALCLNSSHVLSKCTTAVDSSGNCTCP
jgi:hypothetical protein